MLRIKGRSVPTTTTNAVDEPLFDDPAYEVDLVLDTVTIGDLGRLPDTVAERSMRAYLRLIANIYSPTARADARYIQLAMVRYGLWEVNR